MITSKKISIFIALIMAVSIFPILGLPKISSSSEARETHVAYIIRASNEWILPDRNGFVPSKPLLHHWLTVGISYLTGTVDEFSSRFPSAFLGVFIIVALFIFSSRLLEVSSTSKNQAVTLSLLISIILISTYGYSSMLFFSMVDMTFATFVVLALLLVLFPTFEQVLKYKEAVYIRQSTWFAFFVCCGLATLAKGPLGLILPLLIISVVFWSLFGFKETVKISLKPKWGWLAYFSMALPWYYLAQQRSKSAFVERQIFFENIKRFLGGDNINAEPFWFYLPSFVFKAAPWSLLFIALVFWFVRTKSVGGAARKIGKALLLGLAAAFVFFSISKGKRHSYLLPLFPLCAFAGVWMYALWIDAAATCIKVRVLRLARVSFNYFVGILASFSLVLLVAIFIGPTMFDNLGFIVAGEWLRSNIIRLMIAPLLSSALYAIATYRRSSDPYLSLARLFIFMAFFSSILVSYSGIRAAFKNYPEMAQKIQKQASGRTLVAVRNRYDELLDPIFFYLGSPLKVVDPRDMKKACVNNTLFISRSSNLSGFDSNFKIVEEAKLLEKVGKESSLNERAISLFRCQESAS